MKTSTVVMKINNRHKDNKITIISWLNMRLPTRDARFKAARTQVKDKGKKLSQEAASRSHRTTRPFSRYL